MARKQASTTLSMGMVQIPFGVSKASAVENTSLKSLCDCGGKCGLLSNDEGHKVQCRDCGETYNYWNSVPAKGYPLGDQMIEIDPDEIPDESPVPLGQVEKVVPVKRVLRHYAVVGNYYLLPEDDYQDQYGALVYSLDSEAWAILTYLQIGTKTRRYAIMSEGGALLALQLADKKPLHGIEYGTDESLEQQATMMLQGMVEDDPELEDVENQHLKEIVRQKVSAMEADAADAPHPDVEG